MALPAGEDTYVPAGASVRKPHSFPKSRNLTPTLCDHPRLLSSNKLTEAAGRSGAEEEHQVICARWSWHSGTVSTAVTAMQSGILLQSRGSFLWKEEDLSTWGRRQRQEQLERGEGAGARAVGTVTPHVSHTVVHGFIPFTDSWRSRQTFAGP